MGEIGKAETGSSPNNAGEDIYLFRHNPVGQRDQDRHRGDITNKERAAQQPGLGFCQVPFGEQDWQHRRNRHKRHGVEHQ